MNTYLWLFLFAFSICDICCVRTQSQKTQFIFITGGSASGKTTFAKALAKKLGKHKTLIISLDRYLDKRVQPKHDYIDQIPNFDNPSMTNWDLVMTHILQLKNKKAIDMPIYSFSSWMPIGVKRVKWKPFVIVEGIHATQDPLDTIEGLRIFLDVKKEVRYQRRLARDSREKNYAIDFINKTFFEMAIPYEKIFLYPTIKKVDIHIKNLDGDLDLDKVIDHVVSALTSRNQKMPVDKMAMKQCS